MNAIRRLAALGQSIWYDNIRRGMIESGAVQALIDRGVLGITSNPTIFQKAIGESGDYDEAIRGLVHAGRNATQIYEALVMEDIGRTADLFRPVYEATDRRDGFVSIEVEPAMAHDTAGTIARGRDIFRRLGRPNVMIKVPATDAGLPAITALIGEGIHVNVTLIFSVDVYQKVIDAYLSGLRAHVDGGGDPAAVASVASFFVSRLDNLVDARLQIRIDAGQTHLRTLLGQAAVANAKVAYALYRVNFHGPRFAALQARGCRPQRPLWASTSTKNPAYRETIYVDTLIGVETVNTVPPATLEALDRLDVSRPTIEDDLEDARAALTSIEGCGIRLADVTEELRAAGVKAFADSFDQLMTDLSRRAGRKVE